jgi:MoxR-like ATPase
MPIVKCGMCGRTQKLNTEEYGQVKCRCGSILPDPHSKISASGSRLGVVTDEDLNDVEAIRHLKTAYEALRDELAQVIVGQDRVVEELLIAIFARGHCLLEGVPGLAKTLMISTLARALDLSFKRIQFTPDLMPSDITGTEVIQDNRTTGERVFRFIKGPVFANIVLADEINRTPPKTQAALLEAMQEKSVSVAGRQHPLPLPFFVLATQNPLDQEGTYPLPEAQLDRFLFKIFVNYPSDDEELEIMMRVTTPSKVKVEPVLNDEEIRRLQEVVLRVPVSNHVYQYAKRIVRSTRPGMREAPDFIRQWVRWGAGPRASLNLILAGKARAILNGRFHVSCKDIAAVAPSVLRHRIACTFTAQAEGIMSDKVTERLLREIPQDRKLGPVVS